MPICSMPLKVMLAARLLSDPKLSIRSYSLRALKDQKKPLTLVAARAQVLLKS